VIKYLKRFVFRRKRGMTKEIFSRIIESIEEKVMDKKVKVDKSKFVELKKNDKDRKIVFIDGGQAELLKAVNFSLQIIRIGALIYQNNEKVGEKLNEFFLLVYADGEDYKTEIFVLKGEKIEEIKINSMDASIRDGNERASVSKIAGIARRFAEIDMAKSIVKEVEAQDVVVLDGSLKCMVRGEEEKMNELFNSANNEGVTISALAKTSKRVEDGSCIASQLNKAAGAIGEWYYELEEGIGIVKLNKSSEYVFEFNVKNGAALGILGSLVGNSNDAVFPGYPYGLIQVDRFARVSNQEKDYWLTMFKANAGEKWAKIKSGVNVLNAHEILDSIF
jgi:hypothetical protein